MLKGIIFDMDGTLTLTEHLHYEAYRHVFAEHGVTYTWEEERTLYASAGGRYTFTTVFGLHGIHADIDACIAEKERVYLGILSNANVELVPGILPFLEILEKKGIRSVIASTTRRDIIAVTIEHAGLTKFFPDFISGHDITHQKPAPDIFLAALQKMHCVPQDAVVFEDAINGVKAAKAAGIFCIALDTTAEKDKLLAAGAHAVISDYASLSQVPFFSSLFSY